MKMLDDLERVKQESVEATLSKTTELVKTCNDAIFDMKRDIEELNKREQN